MAENNYKSKYEELKQKFMSAVDTAYRLGYQQGGQDAQVEQMQQAQQQAEAAAQQGAAPGQEGGQEGQEPGAEAPKPSEAGMEPESGNPDGTELDQHIAQLEQALGKSEYGTDQWESLNKSLQGMKSYVKNLKLSLDIQKGNKAVSAIAKNLNMAPKFISLTKSSKQADHNMSSHAKATLSLQEQIVDNAMKAWNGESESSMSKIMEILGTEGVSKKE